MSADRTRALLELLYHVSHEVATALDLRTVLHRLLYAAIKNVGGERGSIVVLDDNGRPLDSTIVYGDEFHEHTTQQLRVTVERGLAGWVARNRKSALVPDTSKDERWLRRPDDSIEQSGAKSAICVPLLARERLVGVMTLVHSLPNAFGLEHLELMEAIAAQASVAVLNARLYTESQRQARVMTALAEGAVTINATLRMEEVFQRILNQTMQALQVETAALALLEPEGDLVFRAAAGYNAGSLVNQRIPAGEGVLGKVASEGRGIVVPVAADARDIFDATKPRALAAAPIRAQGKVIGVLEAINPVSGTFDPDALLVMTGIGSIAGTTIQNARLFERLETAHQRYRELFDESIDPILITDWEGNIIETNRRAAALCEYDKETLHSMNILQIHEGNTEKLGAEFSLLASGETARYESIVRTKSGAAVPVMVYVRRVQFDETDALQWTLHDITDRKELDALRNDLMAMIYHDLRSPLANVVSSLDVLDEMLEEGNDNLRSIIEIAKNSTARIQRLISSLLDINRLEANQPIAEQQRVSPEYLVKEAIAAVHPTIRSHQQSIAAKLPQNLPDIWVDADMILRVLINLLENAAKFSPPKTVIEIGAEKDGSWLRLWVQDHGPGIPEKEQKRIFDKFIRLQDDGENESERRPSGLGVGLAFCRLAVQGHGGKIWVESAPGKGARFSLTLPVAKSTQQE
jgi:PAS domain S-box-containing protein